MYSNKYIANFTKICETKFVSEDSIGLENPSQTPGIIGWKQTQAENQKNNPTRLSFKQKLLSIFGIGGVVVSSAIGLEKTGALNAVGEAKDTLANNLVLTEAQREAIQYAKLHPEELRSLIIVNPDNPNEPVNLRNEPNSYTGKKVAELKPGTYIEKALLRTGNDPKFPENSKLTADWYALVGEYNGNYVYAKYTEAPQPNPLNPKNQTK